MNAVSRVSSLSLALPVSRRPFFFLPLRSSRSLSFSLPLSPFLVFGLCPTSFLFGPSLSLLSCSALNSRNPFISRSRFRGSVPFFPLPTYMLAFPLPPYPSSRLPTSPLFCPLRARFSGFSCAPFRPPAYPLRNRSTETCSGVAGTNENTTKGMEWHMRSGRFKGTPQERDATATRCIATPLSSSVFSRFPFRHYIVVLVCPMHSRISEQRSESRIFLTQPSICDFTVLFYRLFLAMLDSTCLISLVLFYSLEFVLISIFTVRFCFMKFFI